MENEDFFRPAPLPQWALEDHGVRGMDNLGFQLLRPLEKPWDRFPVGTVFVDPIRPRLESTDWLALLPHRKVEEVQRAVARHLLQLNLSGFRAACRLFHLDPREGYLFRHIFRARKHLPGTTVMTRDFLVVLHGRKRKEGLKAIRVPYKRLPRDQFLALSEAHEDLNVIMPGSRVFGFRRYLRTREAREARDETSPVVVVRAPHPEASHLRLVK